MEKLLKIIVFIWLTIYVKYSAGNNARFENASIGTDNTISQTLEINFDLLWDNSWRNDIAGAGNAVPNNYDAIWLFIKYELSPGVWKHGLVKPTGNNIGAGFTIDVTTDQVGAFVYRSVNGTGNSNVIGNTLLWDYSTTGLISATGINVQVMAIEMVMVPQGGYVAGDGMCNGTASRCRGGYHSFNAGTLFTSVGLSTSLVSNIKTQGSNSCDAAHIQHSGTGFGIDLDNGIDWDNNSTIDYPDFPTGYHDYYVMKYEITQEQYCDFLNYLTGPQQIANCSATSLGMFMADNNARTSPNVGNGIQCQCAPTASTQGFYACNLNTSNPYNSFDDGQTRACNWMSWDQAMAYLDWCGLRPMSELEFEKACRGPLPSFGADKAGGLITPLLSVGMPVTGAGIPAGTTINAILTGNYYDAPGLTYREGLYSDITISNNATSASTAMRSFGPYQINSRTYTTSGIASNAYFYPNVIRISHSLSTTSISNAGREDERNTTPYANYHLASTLNHPLRAGIFATSTTNTRYFSGASYYGIMDMTGNLEERVSAVTTLSGVAYSRFMHGNGELSLTGTADVATWLNGTMQGCGTAGGYFGASVTYNYSDRHNTCYGINASAYSTIRGVRLK
jgi:hypothetical protein